MSQTATCPECGLKLAVPPASAGRKIRCPDCRAVFTAPGEQVLSLDDAEPSPPPPKPKPAANPFDFEDQPAPRRRRDDDDDDDDDRDRPRRRATRYAKPKNNTAMVVGGVVAAVVGLGAFFGVKYGISALRAPATIPDSKWQTVEAPGLMKAKLPGSPNIQTMNVAGVGMTMRTVTPDEDSMYAVAYSEDELPPHRRGLPAETLLNDACSGSVQGVARDGGHEVSRESITLGPHPGKQIVIDIPKGGGKLTSRVYLVNGRIVMLMAGGRGLEPDHPNVRKLFASLEITADGKRPR